MVKSMLPPPHPTCCPHPIILELPSYMLLEINFARALFLQLQVQPCKHGPFKVCLNNTLWGKSTTFEKVDLLSNPAAICQRRICHCPRKKERKTLLDTVDASQIHTDVLTDTLVCLVKYTKHFFPPPLQLRPVPSRASEAQAGARSKIRYNVALQ